METRCPKCKSKFKFIKLEIIMGKIFMIYRCERCGFSTNKPMSVPFNRKIV